MFAFSYRSSCRFTSRISITRFFLGYVLVLGWWIWNDEMIRLSKSTVILLLCLPLLMAIKDPRMEHKSATEKELYGGFHLALNELPGRENEPPKTEWLNMGYWEATNIFPEACEALALRVASLACQRPGHVLEVGFGCGDSLLLQLQHPAVPRPITLTGITSLPSHFYRAQQRIERAVLEEEIPTHLYLGDAVFRDTDNSSWLTPEHGPVVSILVNHPLKSSENHMPLFDSILGVDCAYHFKTRDVFLRQCYNRLQPGSGRLVLADMCFEPSSAILGWLSGIIAFFLKVPRANLVSRKAYQESLERIGFDGIAIEDISPNVYPGFTAFLRSRGLVWALFAHVISAWHKGGGRFVVVSAVRRSNDKVSSRSI